MIEKYILLVRRIQQLDLDSQRGALHLVNGDVAFEKYGLFNPVRLLCELGVKDAWEVWLAVVVNQGLHFWWVCANSFDRLLFERGRLEGVVVAWRHKILLRGKLLIGQIPEPCRRKCRVSIFRSVLDIHFSGDIIRTAICEIVVLFEFLLMLKNNFTYFFLLFLS